MVRSVWPALVREVRVSAGHGDSARPRELLVEKVLLANSEGEEGGHFGIITLRQIKPYIALHCTRERVLHGTQHTQGLTHTNFCI